MVARQILQTATRQTQTVAQPSSRAVAAQSPKTVAQQSPPARARGQLLAAAARLSDPDLLRRVAALAGSEREATVELVAHLAELDSRRLHVAEGFGSLFSYCTGALRLSEHAAYNRIEAARLSRRFPLLLDLLAEGSLNLSAVRLLAPHLRPENFQALVGSARGRSKREVELLVARIAPMPDVPASIRRLPLPTRLAGGRATAEPSPATRRLPAEAGVLTPVPAPSAASTVIPPTLETIAPALTGTPVARPIATPLATERFRVQFTIGGATHHKLRQAQQLLRREIPDGDPAAIFDRALTLLLEDVARRKLAASAKPRPGRPASTRARHVPAQVKRAVWLRDGGRCAFVAANGRRCGERAFLEFHHREPYAAGGETTEGNISLRCRAHNVYEAELAFGTRLLANRRPGDVGPALLSRPARVRDSTLVGGPALAGGSALLAEVDSPRGEFGCSA